MNTREPAGFGSMAEINFLMAILNYILKFPRLPRKVVARVIHDRRYALFTGRPLVKFPELRAVAGRSCGQ